MEGKLKANFEAGILSKDELDKALIGQKKMFPDGIPECGSDALRFTLCSHYFKSSKSPKQRFRKLSSCICSSFYKFRRKRVPYE